MRKDRNYYFLIFILILKIAKQQIREFEKNRVLAIKQSNPENGEKCRDDEGGKDTFDNLYKEDYDIILEDYKRYFFNSLLKYLKISLFNLKHK